MKLGKVIICHNLIIAVLFGPNTPCLPIFTYIYPILGLYMSQRKVIVMLVFVCVYVCICVSAALYHTITSLNVARHYMVLYEYISTVEKYHGHMSKSPIM